MASTYRITKPEDLMREATEGISPVLGVAKTAVIENSGSIDSAHASTVANSLVQSIIDARKTLANIASYPPARSQRAAEILQEARQRYDTWVEDVRVAEILYLEKLRDSMFKAPSGQEALIARADMDRLLNAKPIADAFVAAVKFGGPLAQLALSPFLELAASVADYDAKALRAATEGVFIQSEAASGNDKARQLIEASKLYTKTRAGMARIAAELPGVVDTDFARRAISWGQPQQG